MKETPLEVILGAKDAQKEINTHFQSQIELIRDLADYGTNLIVRCFNSSGKELKDIVICTILLKQIVAMIDAAYELASRGLVHAAFLPARTAFEASIYMDFILFSDSDKKAIAYFVANYRRELTWARRAMNGTVEAAYVQEIATDLGFNVHASNPTLSIEAAKVEAAVKKTLAQPEFSAFDSAFDAKKGKKKYDPDWFELFDAKSIREVSKKVGRLSEYEIFYGKSSQITHSASYKDHIVVKSNKQIHLKNIRNLEGIDQLVNFVASTAIRSYQHILQNYRPGELEAFAKKYTSDWRTPLLSVKNVAYQYT